MPRRCLGCLPLLDIIKPNAQEAHAIAQAIRATPPKTSMPSHATVAMGKSLQQQPHTSTLVSGADNVAHAAAEEGSQGEETKQNQPYPVGHQPRHSACGHAKSSPWQQRKATGSVGHWCLTALQGKIKPSAEAALSSCLADVHTILSQGTQAVLLSLGAHGCAWCQLPRQLQQFMAGDKKSSDAHGGNRGTQAVDVLYAPAVNCDVVSVNGAGDCLLAGVMAALMQGSSVKYSLCIGVVAACRSCMHEESIPQAISDSWQSDALCGVEGSCVMCEGRMVHGLQASKL
jgi:hypothetical protein